jgi:hypothetical protein
MLFLPRAGVEVVAGIKDGASGLKNSLRRAGRHSRASESVLGAMSQYPLQRCGMCRSGRKWTDFGLIQA